MEEKTRSTTRIVLLLAVVVLAVVGLTSCNGEDFEADHYYAIFGPITPADPGPSCDTFCVATDAGMVSGFYEVNRGETVRFVNFTKSLVKITLAYTYPDGSASTDEFDLAKGETKRITISQTLPVPGTQIEFRYFVGAPPSQGGPGMIVEP